MHCAPPSRPWQRCVHSAFALKHLQRTVVQLPLHLQLTWMSSAGDWRRAASTRVSSWWLPCFGGGIWCGMVGRIESVEWTPLRCEECTQLGCAERTRLMNVPNCAGLSVCGWWIYSIALCWTYAVALIEFSWIDRASWVYEHASCCLLFIHTVCTLIRVWQDLIPPLPPGEPARWRSSPPATLHPRYHMKVER